MNNPLLLLNGWERPRYKDSMLAMGKLGRKGLPRPMPAQELQVMLGTGRAFCSWNASVSELTARWPFLFSHPSMVTNPQKPTQ